MTYRHRTAAALAAVVLSSMGAGFVIGNLHADRVQQPLLAEERSAVLAEIPVVAVTGRSEFHNPSAVALHDIHAYALQHLGAFEDDLQSVGTSTGWSADWRLDWVDVRHAEGNTRIYHATATRAPHVRYTAMWDGAAAHWERSY